MYPELVMKLKGKPSFLTGKNSFSKRPKRDELISFVASHFQGSGREFVPHQLNKCTTDLEWVVDAGNDWWAFFDRHDKQRVRIRHRYDVAEKLLLLAALLVEKFDMEVLTPEYRQCQAEPA